MKSTITYRGRFGLITVVAIVITGLCSPLKADNAPSSYTAYTGTDPKPVPPAPALGPANSVINDPTFGSRILRVTDQNTRSGQSFISIDSGFMRSWNADSTAIKLTGPRGDGYWLEFDPYAFSVGDGSSTPAVHPVPFGATWEWSTVDPNVMYYLSGNRIAKYDKSSGTSTNLGGTSTGDPLGYMAVVVGWDEWVCAAAGPGVQDSRYKIFCLRPSNPGDSKLIDVYNRTINGVRQGVPNWPTSAQGKVIGIHDISGGTGSSWLEVTFHQQNWGANGGAVFNLATNTWSLITNGDNYWSGHVSMGNGTYANSSGSIDGRDSRGVVLRNPDNAMNANDYRFVYQPPNTSNGWCDADHSSWLNSLTNPNAPILISRYGGGSSCYQYSWTGEINAAAVDGSNTVWRFAHNHNAGFSCYYGQSFAQISNDGHWALFSSYWDGTLGEDTAFGCRYRIDTFIVDLMSANSYDPPPSSGNGNNNPPGSGPGSGSGSGSGNNTDQTAGSTTRLEQNNSAISYTGGTWGQNANGVHSGGSATLSMDKGARATMTFDGTGVSWIGYRDEWSGIATVYIDGAPNATVDTYAKPQKAQATNYSISGLSPGSHTITIEVAGSRSASSAGLWVWIDAFDVTAAAPNSTPSGLSTVPAGLSVTSAGSSPLTVGSADVKGSTTTAGLALLSYRSNGVTLTEAGVPASSPVLRGRIDAEISANVNTGFGIENPNDSEATVSFYFTGPDGTNSGAASFKLPAHGQIARFLNQSPFAAPNGNGTFTFTSDIAVSAVAFRGITNERSEFLLTSLPVANPDQPTPSAAFFPQVADGAGWMTQFALVNPTDATITGAFAYVNPDGSPGTSFSYSIAPRSSRRFATPGTDAAVHVASARITPDSGTATPVGVAILSYKRNGVMVSQTGVPSVAAGNAFKLFVEYTGDGLLRTAMAIANPAATPATVNFDLYKLDGSYAGFSGSLSLPASGQRSLFLDEVQGLKSIPRPFRGFVRVFASNGASIAVAGLRGRTNERSDFVMTTTPPVDESAPAPSKLVFPQVVNGAGYTTQFVLYGGGSLDAHSQSGDSLNLNLQ